MFHVNRFGKVCFVVISAVSVRTLVAVFGGVMGCFLMVMHGDNSMHVHTYVC